MHSLWSLRRLVLFMVCLCAAPSFAETAYLQYSVGLSIVPNQNLDGTIGSSSQQSGRYTTNPGYIVGGALGMPFLEFFRAEIALNYRESDLDEMYVVPGSKGGKGEISLFSALVNGYVDFDFDLAVVPYLGVGIGYGRMELRGQNSGADFKIRDEDSVFVWNVMLGTTLPFSDTIDFTAEYRYLATDDPDFNSHSPTIGNSRYDSEYDAHELVLGMRVNF